MRFVKFVMVAGEENNNKFYTMKDLGNGCFEVNYGRVGSTSSTKTYPMARWNDTYKNRISHGYRDVTELFKEESSGEFARINNSQVADIIAKLQSYANKSISDNYTVTASKVTRLQIDEAQAILNTAFNSVPSSSIHPSDILQINSVLVELFKVLPRRMKTVKENLITETATLEEAMRILSKEQDMLDSLSSQVISATPSSEAKSPNSSILEHVGIVMEEVSSEDTKLLKEMLGSNANQFKRAFRVNNLKASAAFENNLKAVSDKTTKLYWHGSRNENWWNILQTSLLVRPSGVVISGKMFGPNIYFADNPKKSIGYTSLRGSYWASGYSNLAYLAVFEVHTGKAWNIFDKSNWTGWMGDLDNSKVSAKGYDSVFAKGGADLRNDEIIVYRENQCRIKYLVEIGN